MGRGIEVQTSMYKINKSWRRAVADGIMLRGGEKQDFQLSAFLFSFSRQMILNLEILNNYPEEKQESMNSGF